VQTHECAGVPAAAGPWHRVSHQKQLRRAVELGNPPRGQHHDAVVVGDGVQPVRDGQHRALPESRPDGALD